MKLKKSFIWNIVICLSVAFATYCMFTGFNFMTKGNALAIADLSMFKYFTIDSNVFAGIVCFIMACFEGMVILRKEKSIPKWVLVLKQMATAAVTLTLLVTVFFLSPQYGKDFIFLFVNANLFFHLLVPLFCIFSYTRLEKKKLPFYVTFTGMIPMILYAIFYVYTGLTHAQGNVIPPEYDWYGFFMFGANSVYIVLGIVGIVMYLISFFLYRSNKKGL